MKQSTSTSAAYSIRRLLRSTFSQSRLSGEPAAVKTTIGISVFLQIFLSRFGAPNQSKGKRPSQPSQPAAFNSSNAGSRSGFFHLKAQ